MDSFDDWFDPYTAKQVVPYLPDDLLLNFLARISKSYYPKLSLVSKRFRSLLTSKEIHKTRMLLGTIESCLYLVLESNSSSSRSLFALCRPPTPLWEDLLVLVPTHKPFPRGKRLGVLTPVGSDIYMIGEYINSEASSSVFVLDCMSHTWRESPSMRIARTYPFVIVINGTIYVIERSKNGPSQDVIEFFDTKTNIWESMPSPGGEIGITGSSTMHGNLYLFGDKKNMVYKPKENKWDVVGQEVCLPEDDLNLSTCLVDNVKYRYTDRILSWWDSKGKLWKAVTMNRPRMFKECWFYNFVRLVNYGGKLAFFWERNVFYERKEIWCTEVTIENPSNGQEDICAKVSRNCALLTVPRSYFLKDFIISTL